MTGPDDIQASHDTHPGHTTGERPASDEPAHEQDPSRADAGADPDDEYEPL